LEPGIISFLNFQTSPVDYAPRAHLSATSFFLTRLPARRLGNRAAAPPRQLPSGQCGPDLGPPRRPLASKTRPAPSSPNPSPLFPPLPPLPELGRHRRFTLAGAPCSNPLHGKLLHASLFLFEHSPAPLACRAGPPANLLICRRPMSSRCPGACPPPSKLPVRLAVLWTTLCAC